jgi:hypothetical protein
MYLAKWLNRDAHAHMRHHTQKFTRYVCISRATKPVNRHDSILYKVGGAPEPSTSASSEGRVCCARARSTENLADCTLPTLERSQVFRLAHPWHCGLPVIGCPLARLVPIHCAVRWPRLYLKSILLYSYNSPLSSYCCPSIRTIIARSCVSKRFASWQSHSAEAWGVPV